MPDKSMTALSRRLSKTQFKPPPPLSSTTTISQPQQTILILSDEQHTPIAYHQHELEQAARSYGFAVFTQPYAACLLASHQKNGIDSGQQTPQIVLPRFIAKGSLEEITFKLSLLHMFQAQGVLVMNSPEALECTVDKGRCAALLQHHRLPIPPSWTTCSYQHACSIVQQHATTRTPLVYKPLCGAQGKGILLIKNPADLPTAEHAEHVWHLQTYIHSHSDHHHYHNWRVFVINGKAQATIIRRSSSWITNISRNATCIPTHEPQIETLACRAAQCLRLDYAGIDIIRKADGSALILEANSIPAWRATEQQHHSIATALIALAHEKIIKACHTEI